MRARIIAERVFWGGASPVHELAGGGACFVEVAVAAVGCVPTDALSVVDECPREPSDLVCGHLGLDLGFDDVFWVFGVDVPPSLQDAPYVDIYAELWFLVVPRLG